MTRIALRSALAACSLFSGALGAAAQDGCGLFEAVEPGDTLATIAERCDVPEDLLVEANPGVDAAAPQVASTLSLTLPDGTGTIPGTIIDGEPVSPGPRIVQAPRAHAEDPSVQVVIMDSDAAALLPPESAELMPILGQWAPVEGICADPETLWRIEDDRLVVGGDTCAIESAALSGDGYVLETICGANGIVVGRTFDLRLLDSLTIGFVTGEQNGVLSRCAPG